MNRFSVVVIASAVLLLTMCSTRGSSMAAPEVNVQRDKPNVETARAQPATTLQPDAFDAPALTAVAEAQKAAGGNQLMYTCPMHPEVTSDKPGICPKCGMTLVKKEP